MKTVVDQGLIVCTRPNLALILGHDNDLQYDKRQTYDKVTVKLLINAPDIY